MVIMIVENAMRAERAQDQGAIDQHDPGVPGGNVTENLAKYLRTAHGHGVELTSLDVVCASLVPRFRLLQQPGQAVVGLGEPRIPIDQGAVGREGLDRLGLLHPSGSLELAPNDSRSARGVAAGRIERLGS